MVLLDAEGATTRCGKVEHSINSRISASGFAAP
jgi:hypothetical protein